MSPQSDIDRRHLARAIEGYRRNGMTLLLSQAEHLAAAV